MSLLQNKIPETLLVFVFETRFHVAQAGFQFLILPPSPKCWNHRHIPLSLAFNYENMSFELATWLHTQQYLCHFPHP